MTTQDIFLGNQPLKRNPSEVSGEFITYEGETYYRIRNYSEMPAFFMSIVSGSDHWLFLSSTGGLTAGRSNAESALFPYETDDKVSEHHEITGPKTLLQVTQDSKTYLWEPFSSRYEGIYQCERHLYKNIYGNKVVFEEINQDLGLKFGYAWRTGDRFGFIKTAWLINQRNQDCQIRLLDGLQNILPYGASTQLQTNYSNLLHAYKRNECHQATGLGLFSLSATLTDRAEPSESLKTTVVWQSGLEAKQQLLSSKQLARFRRGEDITSEFDVKGTAGAYFIGSDFNLAANEHCDWHMVADVNQDHADVVNLLENLKQSPETLHRQLMDDIDECTKTLVGLVAAADGLQESADQLTTAHHFANVLFNIMRGGMFAKGYQVDKADLLDFIKTRNKLCLKEHQGWFRQLPERMHLDDLLAQANASEYADVARLCYEYLPLSFSRRHGDPSRPWNQFSINLKHSNGKPRLDYQGNWRDIFQNWEPMAYAYPEYTESFIAKFLNATTVDGYNPYRVTREGIEWEAPEPDNPWSNIGYWSDHQIIYLQKLLEVMQQLDPKALKQLWSQNIFAYANVPYRLKSYESMLDDWYDTIDFDDESEQQIALDCLTLGTDAKLCRDPQGKVIHVTMVEKLLVLFLAKITNLVPEGGIWMNTQRPEWNDANNALVGKGLSVVTAAYLLRFTEFWLDLLRGQTQETAFSVNSCLGRLFESVSTILSDNQTLLATGFNPHQRRSLMDALGQSATSYRNEIYQGIPTAQTELGAQQLIGLLELSKDYLEQTLRANKTPEGIYHAYNILAPGEATTEINYLYPMLEGQVAILSSGLLSPQEVVEVLAAMKASDLYRADQHSYLLYPDRELQGFLEKNQIDAQQINESQLIKALIEANDPRLMSRDTQGNYHFNGTYRNVEDVKSTLAQLKEEPEYTDLVTQESTMILDLFEAVFQHHAFTGRSGTFFAFEGLGSIYWHMVSKLLLAVQEYCIRARHEGCDEQTQADLQHWYNEVRDGLGFRKSPEVYGAFPTDPYSHTPANNGAKQPGMTGQVKEEILSRWGELGLEINDAKLHFSSPPEIKEELLKSESQFTYIAVDGKECQLPLSVNSLAFTFCQTPIVYLASDKTGIEVLTHSGEVQWLESLTLPEALSEQLFRRTGTIERLQVHFVL